MPIDEASIAQAAKRRSAKSRSAFCSVIGSGVVMPVGRSAADASAAPCAGGGSPMPSVPTTPQRRPTARSASATHHAVEVLPLVPVTATTSSRALGVPSQRLAIAPAAAFRPCSVATRESPSKPKPSTPSASTRQALAPAATAASTKRRPSLAWPGQAMKASPTWTWRLSAASPRTWRASSQACAASRDLRRAMPAGAALATRSSPLRPASRASRSAA